jgi:hypothetical protein
VLRRREPRRGRSIGFSCRVGQTIQVVVKEARRIEERRERREIASVGVKAQQVETDALECRNTPRQLRGSCTPSRF